MYMRRQLWNFRMLATKKHISHKMTFVLYVPLCGNKLSEGLLTLAVAAVTAKIAATRVL